MIIRKGTTSEEIGVNNIEELKNLCEKDDYYLVKHLWLTQNVATSQPKIVNINPENNSIGLEFYNEGTLTITNLFN